MNESYVNSWSVLAITTMLLFSAGYRVRASMVRVPEKTTI